MSSGLLGALAGGALGYFTGGVGSILTGAAMGGTIGGAMDANAQTQASTAQQMAFQERMANSTYQRSVADLRAAGLNPILAASRGYVDPTPSGSSYQAQNVYAGASSAYQQAQSGQLAGEQRGLAAMQTGLTHQQMGNASRTWNILQKQEDITASQARVAHNEANVSDFASALEIAYMRQHPTAWMINRMWGGAAHSAADIGGKLLMTK